eukprot:2657233-Karenia_brevis.AAC.1
MKLSPHDARVFVFQSPHKVNTFHAYSVSTSSIYGGILFGTVVFVIWVAKGAANLGSPTCTPIPSDHKHRSTAE